MCSRIIAGNGNDREWSGSLLVEDGVEPGLDLDEVCRQLQDVRDVIVGVWVLIQQRLEGIILPREIARGADCSRLFLRR